MAVLATVLALAAPRLSGFMWGRNLQEEGRRMFALSRYGRSVAVSQSIPVQLWVNPETRTYGLAASTGFTLEDEKEHEYMLPDGFQFEVDTALLDEMGRGYVSFWPDGTIDDESLTHVIVRGRDNEAVALVQKDFIAGYELVDWSGVDTYRKSKAGTKRNDSKRTSSRDR
jgi:hypothetical protein